MSFQKKIFSNIEIISLIQDGKPIGWELLYDKFAAILYGSILRYTDELTLADNILIDSFNQLENKPEILAHAHHRLLIVLLHHTNKITLQHLPKKINSSLEPSIIKHDFPLLNSCLFEQQTLSDMADKTNMGEHQLRKNLVEECRKLRNYTVHTQMPLAKNNSHSI